MGWAATDRRSFARAGRLRGPRVACLRQVPKKKRAAGVAVRRLVLAPRRVDWPAQPSLDLTQNYFSRISWIVSIVLLPPLLVAIRALSDFTTRPACCPI